MADRRAAMLAALPGLIVAAVLATSATASAAEPPDARLAEILADARTAAARPGACEQPQAAALLQVYCRGEIRIGVRKWYPLFGFMEQDERRGYDVDAGRAIADRLGVTPRFVTVNAADRISKLVEGRIDLIVATMGHNTQRDGQVRFIRPHYYRSETILVGPRDLKIADWPDIAGRSVCVTIGDGSNAQMVSRGARLMLFDAVGVLPARLQDGTCTLAAQDDSFFAYYLAEPGFASRYDVKFGFARVPWGMAVAPKGTGELGEALDLLSQVFHRDGVFLDLARQNRVRTPFLEEQQVVWQGPRCNQAAGNDDPACLQPALDAFLQPTRLAAQVVAVEQWVQAHTGIPLNLAMLKTRPAWMLFLSGLINSLVLVAGAVAATFGFALLFGWMFVCRAAPLRWLAWASTMALQSSPIVLTLVIVAAVAQTMFEYSTAVVLGATAVALGLANGCNAGQAIAEAARTLRAERVLGGIDDGENLFSRAVSRSAMQIISFLVNATKGTPIAAFIGAPELLSALTDITSFASGRETTYGLVLVFYILVVMAVMGLFTWFGRRLERAQVAA